MFTRTMIAVSALLFGSSALVGIGFSGATWTHETNARATVSASPDWTPPTVTVSALQAGIFGTVTVTATAVDARSAIASVTLEYAPAGETTWTPITTGCTASSGSSPLVYSCQWNTATAATPDDDYQVRARTTDAATPMAYTATSAAVPTQVANSTAVVLTTVPDHVRGTVALTVGFLQSVSGTTRLYLEYRTGATTWNPIGNCTPDNVQSMTCSWNTTDLPAGSYALRATAKKGSVTWTDEQSGVVVDNEAPTLDSLTVPSGVLSGVVQLAATASDAVSPVDAVAFDYQLGAGSWVPCGTDLSAPYGCSLNTVALTSGSYTFRAIATDAAGNTSAYATQMRTVSNAAASVSIASPTSNTVVSGASFPVTAIASSDRGIRSVRVDARLLPSGNFVEVCTDEASPTYSCSWNASVLGSGSYELRAVMTETHGGATLTSSAVTVTVNNSLGSVAVTTPPAGSTVSGMTSVSATATPAIGTTVSSVRYEAGPVGGPYVAACVPVSEAPYTCSWDTSATAYAASYELRAIMLQSDNSTVTSGVSLSVDNVVASVSISSPAAGGRVRGSAVSVAASTSVSTPGLTVSSVHMEGHQTGGTFATLCTDESSPFVCTWNTPAITYGNHELRAVMTLSNGTTRTSSTVNVIVDNRALAAVDVQATNGNGTLLAGDTLVFTYSSLVNLDTLLGSAWAEDTSAPISLAFFDKSKNGNISTTRDAVHFSGAQLGWVTFAQNYVTNNSSETVPATISASNASGVTVVTVVLGVVSSTGNKLVSDAGSGAMSWLPTTVVADIFGNAATSAVATESGTSDADF